MLDEIPMIRETDICYLAGPMTGMPMFNYPAFYGAAGLIEKEFQCEVLNPAELPDGHTYEEYMTMCFALIEKADVVVFLDGWQKSSGAKREFELACKLRKHIRRQYEVEQMLKTMKQESEVD